MKLKHLHYGWVMVVIATFINIAHAFMIYTFGIFLRPLTLEFDWDRGELSGAFSIFMLMSGVLSILSGKLCDRYGPRLLVTISGLLAGMGFLLMSQVNSLWQVYLIWGLLMGISSGCCYIPVLSTIPRWFRKRRGIAMGLTATGAGLGGMISPPLAQLLISSYGWQQASIVLCLIVAIIIIPLAQFMKHSPQRIGLRPYGEDINVEDPKTPASDTEGFSFKQTIKTGRFWFYGLLVSFYLFIVQVIITHIAPYAIDTGIPAMVAASVLSVLSATSLIGRNLTGFICDKAGGRLTQSACLTLITLALIWLLFARETWMLYLFAAVIGIAIGGMGPLLAIVTAELFGLSSLGVILGSVFLFRMIGGALGAPLAGSIFDVTGNYSLAFLICVIIGALAIILSLALLKAKGWRGGE